MTTRLISAGIGIVIAVIVLILHNTVLFPIAIGIVSFLMLMEFFRANRLLKYRIATIAGLVYALLYPVFVCGNLARYKMLLTVACICGLLGEYIYRKQTLNMRSFFALMTGVTIIPYGMSALVLLNASHEQHGLAYVILALAGAWIADSGAYFAGTFLGKHKLCPSISPKKTVEGFIGGLLANLVAFELFGVIYTAIMKTKSVPVTFSWFGVMAAGLFCAILGTVGDLSASVLKRQLGIKDYGTIMPGHGGMLDRFDSVLLVAPFLCAYINAFGFFGV